MFDSTCRAPSSVLVNTKASSQSRFILFFLLLIFAAENVHPAKAIVFCDPIPCSALAKPSEMPKLGYCTIHRVPLTHSLLPAFGLDRTSFSARNCFLASRFRSRSLFAVQRLRLPA